MPFKISKRQGLFAASITVLGLAVQPAFASPATDLIDKYNAWYLESGFEKASYAEAIETGDTTELRDYNVAGIFTIKNDEGEPTLSFYADINIPKMIIEDSAVNGDVYSYGSMKVANATYEIRLIDEDEAPEDIARASSLETVAVISGAISGYSVVDYAEEWAERPALKEGMTQEAFLQLLGLSLNSSYAGSSIDEMTVTSKMAEAFGNNTVFTGFKTGSFQDGVTQSISLESYSSVATSMGIASDPKSEVKTTTTTTYDNLKINDLDIRPLLAFFKVAEAPSNNYISSYSSEAINMEILVDGAKSYDPIGLIKLSAASSSGKDLSIEGGDGLKLLSLLERLKSSPSGAHDDLFVELLGAIGSYNIGYFDLKDLSVTSWDPIRARRMNEISPSFEMKLASLSLSDLGLVGLGNLTLEGFHGAVEGDDAIFDIGSFELTGVSWPSAQEIYATSKNTSAGPQAALALAPTIEKFSITNAEAQGGDLPTPVFLKELTIEMGNHIGPIPTQISDVIDTLSFDAALLDEPIAKTVLGRLGIERVTLNQNFKIAWDENTNDLTIEQFEFELKGGVKLRADIQLGNIPRSLFENPFNAEAVVALATFKGAQIEVMESPLVSELLAAQAEQSGVPAEMLTAMMVDGTLQQAGPLSEITFMKELAEAVKSFAGNPTNIKVTLAPDNEISIMQLGGLAALAPQQLPELLGATVNYTE
ncbi:hypothetical protein PsAD2_03835 [Pseudovibrio axinellae]|uniref:Uncharacterized protein n=1 Tax=Pseudovibrio axinellae TaxID=989403 RepID=A0A165ULW4_9HYPH|nr:hypothetical protein [Pseudovibrio axinellae]KZL12530.1 hypothetical protein PsAD2_03835 [Pseudovibrio axinellae]SEP68296.1 hypothetical protein SAMN05421798_101145 [Pseudovibrio axinellae]